MADVARRAGVAEPTVRAVFKTKRRLLEDVVASTVREGNEEVPLAHHETFKDVLAADNAKQLLARVANMTAAVHERSWDVIEIVIGAASTDPDIAALLAKRRRARRSDHRLIALRLHELGELSQDTDLDTVTDLLWVYTAPEVYRMLAIDRRWSQRRYCSWLQTTLRLALTAPSTAHQDVHKIGGNPP